MNPGGLTAGAALATLQWYRQKYQPDVIFIVESRVLSHQAARVVANRLGCCWVGVQHPRLVQGPGGVYGGIGAIVCNRQVRVTLQGVERRGLMAASVSVKGKLPITCLATYLPCETSPHRADVEVILEATKREYALAARMTAGDQVLWLGDFNTSLGNGQGHFTHDSKVSSASRCNLIRGVMRHLGMLPLHGRAEHEKAECTSLPAAERHRDQAGSGREVDYIMGPTAWQLGTDYWLVPTPLPARAVGPEHRPRRAGLRPLDRRVQQQQAQLDREVPVDMFRPPLHLPLAVDLPLRQLPAGDVAAPQGRQKRVTPAAYLSAAWTSAAEMVTGGLRRAGDAARSLLWRPGPSAAAPTLDGFRRLLQTTAENAAAGERRDEVPARIRGPRQYCRGRPLPVKAVSALNEVRAWRKRIKRIHRTCRGEQLQMKLKDAAAEFKASMKRKRQAIQEAKMQWLAEEAGNGQALQMWDPHSHSKKLKSECNLDPLLSEGRAFIPSAPGAPPAAERFVSWCRSLFGEDRPAMPALSNPTRMQFVPRAPEEDLARDVHWEEVMYVLFPPSKRSSHCCPRQGGCEECIKRLQDLDVWEPSDPDSPYPHWCNRIHTSKAPGPDGFHAENARWMRPRDLKSRFDFRASMCKVYADVFTDCLRRGEVPSSFKEGLSLPLLKQTKDGARPDAANPDNYRVITMSNVDAKLFGLVILSRLQHWASQHGLISGTQNAFRPRRNCEQHVLTLHEVISSRSHAGRTTWGLFIDFKKAYDSVNQDALWRVAETAGIPANLIRVLRNWNTGRTATLDINGERTAPYPITKGVPQGDVLSPWLFNLFLEPLLREIQQDEGIQGVAAFGRRFKELVYADDIVVLSESLDEVQYVLDKVIKWGKDWGLELGVGNKKTEIVAFSHQPRPQQQGVAAAPAPVIVGGLTVQVVDEYKYLGYMATRGMGGVIPPLVGKYATVVTQNFNRFFRSNTILSRQSLRAQAITCKTYVTSGTNYLACMLPAHLPPQAATLDCAAEACYKHILRLPGSNHPRGVYPAEMRATLSIGVWSRERMRLYLDFLVNRDPNLPLHDVLAAQKAASEGAGVAGAGPGARPMGRTWWDDTLAMIAQARVLDVEVPDHRRLGRQWVKQEAAIFGRKYAFAWWQKCAQRGVEDVASTYSWLNRPPEGTKAMVAWLHGGYLVPACKLGSKQHSTPLSVAGPGCSGSVLSNARISKSLVERVLAYRAGRQHAYLMGPPKAAPVRKNRGRGRRGAAAPVDEVPDAARWRGPRRCLACGTEDAPDDMYHHMVECPHTAMQRRTMQQIARKAVEGILAEAAALTDDVPQLFEDVTLARRALSKGVRWDAPANRSMLFHLALAQPWSVEQVPIGSRIEQDGTGDATLAALLGVIFDEINLQPYRTARLCTRWARDAAQLVHACDKARERHHPVPQRRMGVLPLAEEEGQRPAVAAAVGLVDAEADDPRGDDLLVAAIDADIRRLMQAEVLAEPLAVAPVEAHDDEESDQEDP
jgi:sorting nexin-29